VRLFWDGVSEAAPPLGIRTMLPAGQVMMMIDDDDDDDNKPVRPLGLWAPSFEGRDVSTSITYVVKSTYSFVIVESGHPRQDIL
jgi:hypothetical protein